MPVKRKKCQSLGFLYLYSPAVPASDGAGFVEDARQDGVAAEADARAARRALGEVVVRSW